MAKLDKRITLKATRDFHRQVKVKAAEEEHSGGISEVVRKLLEKWLAGEVTLNNGDESRSDERL